MKPHLTCPVHKDFKEYQEHLLNYKNWCIVICTFLSIPLCLFGWIVNLNLAWTYYFTGILIASSVVPIAMSITWARTTAAGQKSTSDILDITFKVSIVQCGASFYVSNSVKYIYACCLLAIIKTMV